MNVISLFTLILFFLFFISIGQLISNSALSSNLSNQESETDVNTHQEDYPDLFLASSKTRSLKQHCKL